MGIRSLVSFGILIIPVGVTIGVLVGLDAYRVSTGQDKLFVDNRVVTNTYCQKAYGIHPESQGERYTLNPNQWGWTVGEPGALCMNVTAFQNGSYPSRSTAPEFSVTWQYPQGSADQPVHAFPNIKLDGDDTFPVPIGQVRNINIDVKWTYGVGSTPSTDTVASALTGVNMNGNVAIDMFLDADGKKARSTTDARYEVMVWLAAFGAATQPIGLADGIRSTQTVNGTVFNLYYGANSFGQFVLTWMPAGVILDEFVGDIAPLVNTLSSVASIQAPTASTNLGYIGLGSEALYSTTNVTFHVPKLSMQIMK